MALFSGHKHRGWLQNSSKEKRKYVSYLGWYEYSQCIAYAIHKHTYTPTHTHIYVPVLRICGFCTFTSTQAENTIFTSFSALQQYMPASSLLNLGMIRQSEVWLERGTRGVLNQRKLGVGTPVALHSRMSCWPSTPGVASGCWVIWTLSLRGREKGH